MARTLSSRTSAGSQSSPIAGGTSRRATPLQRRSIERVQAILDAAETLLGSQGYEGATLKAISDHAGIPTASVYHYFPDRHAVEVALMQRHRQELDERVGAGLKGSKPGTIRDVVQAAIDPLLDYFRQAPGLVELWFTGRHRNPEVDSIGADFDQAQAEQLWALLIKQKLVRRNTAQLVVELAYEAGNTLFDVAFRRSPTGDDEILEEARRLITAYLELYAPTRRT